MNLVEWSWKSKMGELSWPSFLSRGAGYGRSSANGSAQRERTKADNSTRLLFSFFSNEASEAKRNWRKEMKRCDWRNERELPLQPTPINQAKQKNAWLMELGWLKGLICFCFVFICVCAVMGAAKTTRKQNQKRAGSPTQPNNCLFFAEWVEQRVAFCRQLNQNQRFCMPLELVMVDLPGSPLFALPHSSLACLCWREKRD